MSVKITCDVEENRLFGMTLMWPLWKMRLISEKENGREQEKEKRGVGEVGGGVIRWA